MVPQLTTHLLPELLDSAQLPGGVAVVIDCLRATTTLACAFQNGAATVFPCLTVEAAQALRAAQPGLLLGGERGGLRIEGFDLDNSPRDWSSARVSGRVIAFTTTNGTRALLACQAADRILTAALVNLAAVVDCLVADGRPVHLVCAGSEGRVASEDCLVAGALIDRLLLRKPTNSSRFSNLCDASKLCRDHWRAASGNLEMLHAAMRNSLGGRHLIELGLAADVEFSTQIDVVGTVPEFSPESRALGPAGG